MVCSGAEAGLGSSGDQANIAVLIVYKCFDCETRSPTVSRDAVAERVAAQEVIA